MALEIEIIGGDRADAPDLRRAAAGAARAAGVDDGHVAVTMASPDEIRALNRRHRGRDRPTDVLSFPVDGTGPSAGPRELGDVVVCADEASDVVEAVVHGVLHLCGHDHEDDRGEMLELQNRVLEALR